MRAKQGLYLPNGKNRFESEQPGFFSLAIVHATA
jgi:hypothetical protein